VILAAAVSTGSLASAAYAHHSHPYFYDQCKSVTIEGRIESVQWKSPHSIILVRLDDGMAYTIDWRAPWQLTREGILESAQGALVFGARLSVTGNPIRTAAQIREHFPSFTSEVNPKTIDPRAIRRVDDSFNWGMSPDSFPLDCSRG